MVNIFWPDLVLIHGQTIDPNGIWKFIFEEAVKIDPLNISIIFQGSNQKLFPLEKKKESETKFKYINNNGADSKFEVYVEIIYKK